MRTSTANSEAELYSHAPSDYVCPLCRIAGRDANSSTPLTTEEDVFHHDDLVTAFVAAAWWDNNPGHAIVIPNEHFENIFDLPVRLATEIHRVARDIAIAFKTVYGCDGVDRKSVV